MITAVIPARSGSVRIPSKNSTPLPDGLTLVDRAISSAQNAAIFHRVVVSTDSEEIATLARNWHADVVMRGPELAEVGAGAVVLHACESMSDDGHVAMILPTSPFRLAKHVTEAVDYYFKRDPGYSTVISVSPAVNSRGLCYEAGDGLLTPLNIPKRFADGEWDQTSPVYQSNGAIQVAGVKSLRLAEGDFWRIPKRIPYPMDGLAGWDVDDRWQWILAQTLIGVSALAEYE